MSERAADEQSRSPESKRDESLGVMRVGPSYNRDPERQDRSRKFAVEAARSLEDDKCEDVLVLDLRGRSQVTDYFVIASGTSERQMKSSGQHVSDLSEEMSMDIFRHNLRESETKWIILDFVDVVVHIFEPEERVFYDLEMLWGDADRVNWQRPGDPRHKNRAGLRQDDVLPE